MAVLVIESVRIDALKPYPGNARVHPKSQIRALARSLKEFGFVAPVLADRDNGILAGHGRIEAARTIGMAEVPVVRVEHLSEAKKRAYILADNRLAESARWDLRQLAIEFKDLIEIAPDLDLSATGFPAVAIDTALRILDGDPDEDDLDDLGTPDVLTPVSKLGDLWVLGSHRLLCGDARDASAYERLMAGTVASLIVSDPPYNIRIDGNVVGKGKHREFAMASGEMNSNEFVAFLETTVSHLVTFSSDGSLHFLFMDWRHIRDLIDVGERHYGGFLNLVVWAKTNAGMGSLYRSQHELVGVFKNGTAPHVNNVELGKHGRHRSNVWTCPGMNAPGRGRARALDLHPTCKPVRLIADAILDCSHRGDLVLDPFCGSGTTLIAAERTGRLARCMEIDPLYVDAAIRRWERATGQKARHADTGQPFGMAAAEEAKP